MASLNETPRTYIDHNGRTRMAVPPLNGCNSWVIVRRDTTEAIVELYDPNIVSLVDSEKFDALTARDHLQRLNAAVVK